MSNLKVETLNYLKTHEKDWSDVRWVGHCNGNVKIHPDYFLEIADREYDANYGAQQINCNLVIVGDDWWLERHEYDGSEWWEFKSLPILNPNAHFGKTVYTDSDDDWSVMSNLEYLEWEQSRHA